MKALFLIFGLSMFATIATPSAAYLPTTPSNSKAPVRLTATETVLGDMNQAMPTPDGMHNISFKGMGDVIGAIVIDGKINPVPPGFMKDSFAVSADGKRLAYVVRKDNNKRVVVVDGVEGQPYDMINTPKPVFSPDGKQVAYIAQIGPGDVRQGKTDQFIVLNGAEGKHYGNIWPFVMFSPDSKHVLYIAANDNSRPGVAGAQYFLVDDGSEGKAYTGNGYITPQQNITFSPDGKRLAYSVFEGKQSMAVIDGVEGKAYEGIAEHSFVFSPDSKRIVYQARRGGKDIMVIDGVESAEFDAPQQPGQGPTISFSADSKHLAYVAKHGGKYFVVEDGVEGKSYDYVDMLLTFSPDGKHLAYSAKDGDKQFVVVDGIEGKSYAGAWNPAFSPDGKHFAYWVRPNPNFNEQVVVVDGVEGKKYGSPAAGPIFSPDGKHVAYAASQSAGQPFEVVVVDGVEFHPDSPLVFDPRFGMVIANTFYFESPSKLDFVAMKMPTQQFVRLTIEIK